MALVSYGEGGYQSKSCQSQERLLDLSLEELCMRSEASPFPSQSWAASSSSPPSSSTSSSQTPLSRPPWKLTSKPEIQMSLLLLCRSAVKPSIRNAVTKPGILIALFKVGSAACSLGFLQTTLEPHLSTLKPALSSFQVATCTLFIHSRKVYKKRGV